MFNPAKDDYPQNEAGRAEFASITLHLDPALANADTDVVVQKMVLATDTPIEALAKIAPHFNEPGLLAQPKNAAAIAASGQMDNPVFVYVTPREGHTVIITSTRTWDDLVQHPDFGQGSSLLTSEKVQELVAKVMGDQQQFAGGFASLLVLDFTTEDPSEQQQQQQQPGFSAQGNQPEAYDDDTFGGAGSTAESLVETAEVQQV